MKETIKVTTGQLKKTQASLRRSFRKEQVRAKLFNANEELSKRLYDLMEDNRRRALGEKIPFDDSEEITVTVGKTKKASY